MVGELAIVSKITNLTHAYEVVVMRMRTTMF